MTKPRKYKFLGPWLRRLRVQKGIERTWLAKHMSRATGDIMNMELGLRAVPSLKLIKSWLRLIQSSDQYPTAVKLWMADGDKLEVDIRALRLEERLRLIAIVTAFKDRAVHPRLMDLIDEALFEKPVTVTKVKHCSPSGALNTTPVKIEFEYNHAAGEVESITEHFYDGSHVKDQGESGGEGSSENPGDNLGSTDAKESAVCGD